MLRNRGRRIQWWRAPQSCLGAEICDVFKKFLPRNQSSKVQRNVLRLLFVNHQGRDSDSSTAMPIWVDGDFRSVETRLINEKTELLIGMDIIKTAADS